LVCLPSRQDLCFCRQTADTFQAAATFLELCQIWGDLDPEIAGRIKFAKYHAVRIAKAIKAGEDPNATNPAPKEEEEAPVTDPDVQAFDESVAEEASKPQHASVEEIQDDADRLGRQMAHHSSLDESLHPSRASSLPRPPVSSTPEIPSVPQNAPGSPARMDIDDQHQHSGGLELPSTPATLGKPTGVPNLSDTPGSHATHTSNPSNTFQSFPPPAASPSVPAPNPASFYDPSSASAHIPPPAASASGPSIPRAPVAPPPAAPSKPSHGVDDNSITLAQKHARWAVSALTFDDVDTAIKELKNSLRYLGAE